MSFRKLMPRFEKWYAQEEKGKREDYYSIIFTRDYLERISDAKLKEIFIEFCYSGGEIQTQGQRNVKFIETISTKTSQFREHILEPFKADFNFKEWFGAQENGKKKFPGWGPGISTIYLANVNKNRFSILNDKTLTVAAKLLPDLYPAKPSATTFKAYIETHSIQIIFMEIYSNLNNFIKVDGFFEFLNRLAPAQLAKYWSKQDAYDFNKIIEEKEIEEFVNHEGGETRDSLLKNILKLTTTTDDIIKYEGKRYERNAVVTEKIKKLRNYTCQFCGTTILKKDGTRYVEACHINPKKHGGPETLTNILILCPNCHKEFDYGLREKEVRPAANIYKVLLNGRERTAEFETVVIHSNEPADD